MAKKLKQSKILNEFKKIHGDKYDYTLVRYINAHAKVKIVCKKHGVFLCSANNHKRGRGCPKCKYIKFADNRKLSNLKSEQELILDLIYAHNYTVPVKGLPGMWIIKPVYKYKRFQKKYKNINSKIDIICSKHGLFSQSFYNHRKGHGCQKCANESKKINTWRTSKWIENAKKSNQYDGFKLYLVKCSNKDEIFFKIGKTFRPIHLRLNDIPYDYILIDLIQSDNGRYISELECKIHAKLKNKRYAPNIFFGGHTECYTIDLNLKSLSNI